VDGLHPPVPDVGYVGEAHALLVARTIRVRAPLPSIVPCFINQSYSQKPTNRMRSQDRV
jgi:hypothetical protein